MKTSYILTLFSGIVLFSAKASGSLSKCMNPCDENQKVTFKQGHTYVYHYQAESYLYVNVTNTEQQDAANKSLKLSAEVELHILSPCHVVMEIHNATLQDTVDDLPNYYENFSDAISQHEVRIQYSNGAIKELCVVESELAWVLNIKRGILSMLQYDLQNTTSNYSSIEKSMWGTCRSNYTSGESDGWKTLKRKRIYKDCIHWGDTETFNFKIGEQYMEPDDLFKNTQVCKYVFGNTGQPVLVACKERQKFHPHASKVNMAVSNITQHLDLDRVIVKNWASKIEDSDLIYENITFKFTDAVESLELNSLQEFLTHISDMFPLQIVKTMILRGFKTLIRYASYDDLLNAVKIFQRKHPQYVRVLISEILSTKTSATVEVINYLHQKKIITELDFFWWLKSLPFIKYPNKQLLEDVKIFLDENEADLAISGLVLNYCRNTPNCTDDENVQFYISYWDRLLKIHLTKFNQRNSTLALLAIGNTGLTNKISLIGEIITKSTYPPMLRLTAIESLRKMPCSSKTEYLKEVFKKWNDNAEVRISAYLALCKCPSSDVLHHILVTFNVEGINEVTTFIWDHFSKSQTLPEEWKVNITQVIQDNFLKTEHMTFIPNHAKYFEQYGNFSVFDAKVELLSINIYQNTQLWSSYAKFSFGLFGNDVDKVEIYGRVRDINGIIESLFPRKYSTLSEDNKYSSEESLANNIILVEDNLLKPLTDDRYLQSGSLFTRVFDVDISTTNPFNISFNILENLRQHSTILKESLVMQVFDVGGGFLQFPTSAGYTLEFSVILQTKGGVTMNDVQQNYKSKPVSKYNIGCSGIFSRRYDFSTVIAHNAYIAKTKLHYDFIFDMQAMFKVDAHIEQNKIHKFSFDVDPLLSDNKMFNITSTAV